MLSHKERRKKHMTAKYQVVATAYKLGESENAFFTTQKAALATFYGFGDSGVKTKAYRMLTLIDLRQGKKVMRQYGFVQTMRSWKKVLSPTLLMIDMENA